MPTRTGTPVTMLISWCMLITLKPVMIWIMPDKEQVTDQVGMNVLGAPAYVFLLEVCEPWLPSRFRIDQGSSHKLSHCCAGSCSARWIQ